MGLDEGDGMGIRETRSDFMIPAGPTDFILEGDVIVTAHLARKKGSGDPDKWVDKNPVRITVVKDLMNGKFFVLLIPQKGGVDPKMIPVRLIGRFPLQQDKVRMSNTPTKWGNKFEYKFKYKTFTLIVPEDFIARI